MGEINEHYIMQQNKLNGILDSHEKWLKSNQKEGEKAYFCGVNLSEHLIYDRDLTYAEFCNCKLNKTGFIRCHLNNTTFINVRANKSSFIDCFLNNSRLICSYFFRSTFFMCEARNFWARNTRLANSRFNNVNFTDSLLKHTDFDGAEFIDCIIKHTDFTCSDLSKTKWS